MKVSAKDRDDNNNLDAMLFAYVEGELTEEETKQLEEELALDTSLQAELDHWKESFVTQDFYATEKLEKSLLKEKVSFINLFTTRFIFVIALLALLYSMLPFSLKEETVADQNQMRVSIPESLPAEKKTIEEKAAEKSQPAGPVSKKDEAIAIHQNSYTANRTGRKNVLPAKTSIQNLPILKVTPSEAAPAIPVIEIPDAKMKKLLAKKTAPIRQLSKQERRKIIRMKERALQQRKANEFLKGNIPYVVPLNTNNF